MKPRYYQQAAAHGAWAVVEKGGKPVIELPTGSGKSLVASILSKQAAEDGEPSIVVTHRRELVRQNQEALLKYDTELGLKSRVYCAGLNDKSLDAPVTFVSVDSLVSPSNSKHLDRLLSHVGLLVIDEAHRVSKKGTGSRYDTLLNALPQSAAVIGMTATPFRGDGVSLIEGEDAWFTHVVPGVSYRSLVKQELLVPLYNVRTRNKVDMSGVRLQQATDGGKDFNVTESEARVRAALEPVVSETVHTWTDFGKPAALVFLRTIDTAYKARDLFRDHGLRADALDASTPLGERDKVLSAFKAGHTDFLCSVDTVSTGFDAPIAGLGVYLRPTASPVWHVQALGRLTRPAPGKQKAHVLDFVGNLLRCGPIDDPVLKEDREKAIGEPPCKECPACAAVVHARAKECPECGYEWPEKPLPKEFNIKGHRGKASSLEDQGDVWDVLAVRAVAHRTAKGPIAIKLLWELRQQFATERVVEFINLNAAHPYAKSKGRARLQELGASSVPEGWEAQLQALDSTKVGPKQVRVTHSKQGFPQVKVLEWGGPLLLVSLTPPSVW